MSKGTRVSIARALGKLKFLPDRTPETSPADAAAAFCALAEYRDGAIYAGHYAGHSEWERHPHGDEIVWILHGETTLILLVDGEEQANRLVEGELLVVPQNVWHRFDTPAGVTVIT